MNIGDIELMMRRGSREIVPKDPGDEIEELRILLSPVAGFNMASEQNLCGGCQLMAKAHFGGVQ